MRSFFSWRTVRDIALIVLGTSVYGFGLVYLNIPNDLAEGGVTGITLIMRALWDINPAYSTLILNIPIILLGGKISLGQTFASLYSDWNLWSFILVRFLADGSIIDRSAA